MRTIGGRVRNVHTACETFMYRLDWYLSEMIILHVQNFEHVQQHAQQYFAHVM